MLVGDFVLYLGQFHGSLLVEDGVVESESLVVVIQGHKHYFVVVVRFEVVFYVDVQILNITVEQFIIRLLLLLNIGILRHQNLYFLMYTFIDHQLHFVLLLFLWVVHNVLDFLQFVLTVLLKTSVVPHVEQLYGLVVVCFLDLVLESLHFLDFVVHFGE